MRLNELSGFSPAVLAKARRLINQALVKQDVAHPSVYWVSGDTGDYRVQFGDDDEFVTCTCAHGLQVGAGDARCSHVAASIALREVVEEERQPPPGPTVVAIPDPLHAAHRQVFGDGG